MSREKKPKGTTVPEMNYSEIVHTARDIDHARGVVAASADDAEDARLLLQALGLMPDQRGWYKDGQTRKRTAR